jgi:pilus assembly protein CpaF
MIEFRSYRGLEDQGVKTFSASRLVIGSAKQCSLRVTGLAIGGQHAYVERRPSGYFVKDAGLLAGTRVNGSRVADYGPLAVGDELAFGLWRFRVTRLESDHSINAEDRRNDSPNSSSMLVNPTPSSSYNLDHAEGASGAIAFAEQGFAPQSPQPSAASPQPFISASLKNQCLKLMREVLDSRRRDWGALTEESVRTETLALIRSELKAQLDELTAHQRQQLESELVADLVGLGPLEELMRDRSITEIMVNGPSQVFVERDGQCQPSQLRFSGVDELRRVIDRIFIPMGRRIDDGHPMADGRLPDGSRVNAVLSPPAIGAPSITIRKYRAQAFTLADLSRSAGLDSRVINYLTDAVESGRNIVVSGGTGSGKTTLLRALAMQIPKAERIVSVEDAAELHLKSLNVVALEAREANQEGQGHISIRDLVRNALRMRPDRIVVGECRGGEALDMLQAMNTGHEGSLTTVHANTPRDALSRIEVMVMMAGFDLPLRAIREQIASAVHLVVHQQRLSGGQRTISEIVEVAGMESGTIQMEEVFSLRNGFRDGVLPQFRTAGGR